MIAVGLILWILSVIVIFKFKYINQMNPASWIAKDSFDWIATLFFLFFFSGIGFFAKTFIRLFSNSKISKLNIKGELELGDNTDKSVFNEHLEEILYFFERTFYNVVVIEDLDRFDSTDIFTKLREINILLNNSKLIKREINFLYAIKDEMFTDKNERVKFFEYIIPVIPFINPSTAGDQLTKMIKEASLTDILSKNFTEDIVTFIDDIDMRLLINIFHEYLLYKQNLIPELNQDNLFAIITYKNLFPDDFGDLQKRKGKLYSFISNKENYIKNLIEKIDEEIKNKNIEIKNIDKEIVIDIKELRAIYINAIHSTIPQAISLFSTSVSFSNLSNDEEFEKLLDSENIHYNSYVHNYSNQYYLVSNNISNISFSDIENSVNPNFTYNEREQLILDKKGNRTQILKKEIEKLKAKKTEIESLNLQQIFEEIDINNFIDGFANNELIRNLLLNGYINENYNDYISLFHEVNLTKDDYVFEKNLKSGIHSDFNYKLIRIENLVSKINDKYFSRDAILNFDLVDFLAENIDKNSSQYNAVIKLLSSEKEKAIDFVFAYVDQREKHIGLFIKSICKSWVGFWDYIYLTSNFTDERTKHYLKLILKYADIEDIVFFKNGSNIATYIVQQPNFLSFIEDSNYNNKIKELLKFLNIKFESLNTPTEVTNDLFNYVYENNHYLLTTSNISLMLSKKGIEKLLEKINEANYTTILDSECKSLTDYVNKNINEYVKNVFLKIPENISESEESIITLLNNEDLKDGLKLEVIKMQTTLINNLSVIDDYKIQEKLIQCNKIVADWNNVFVYYDKFEVDEFNNILIDFLNLETNFLPLADKKLKENNQKKEDYIKNFSIALIKTNQLSYESYSNLINSTTYIWSNINFENLDFDKVECLVKNNKLSLSVANFEKLKEHFPNLHLSIIEKYQSLFISKFEEYNLYPNDTLRLLLSTVFSLVNKITLIQKIDDNIIIENKEIGKTVCNLLSNYNYIPLEYNVLESLFKHSNSTENRVQLLNKHTNELTVDQIKYLVELLGKDYQEVFIKKHRPTFSNTNYHHELFSKLENKKLISSSKQDSKKPELIRVIALS